MPEPVECEICGSECDPRGLAGHKRMKHGNESGDGGAAVEPVEVDRDEIDVDDDDLEEALPTASVTEDTITFRSIQEIEVADEEMKAELLEALKDNFIRGGSVQL